MKKGDLLFVYGSLRKGEGADLSLKQGAEFVSSDRINGRLYAVSWFPGVKDVPDTQPFDPLQPAVVGDVFHLTDAFISKTLDGYEGYPSLYNRCQVLSEKGETVWVYTYNHPVSEDSRVLDGDWCLRAKPSNRMSA